MDPLAATELFKHMDYDALGKRAPHPRSPRRQHLISRLRNRRQPPRE